MYTGNTRRHFCCCSCPAVYPCVYREHSSIVGCLGRKIGLSLCIQGTQLNDLSLIIQIRFIPVYTGNTYFRRAGAIVLVVYPCVYREHRCTSTEWGNINGLSLCIQGTRKFSRLAHSHFAVYPCVYREHKPPARPVTS